jgi:hypothetical protein
MVCCPILSYLALRQETKTIQESEVLYNKIRFLTVRDRVAGAGAVVVVTGDGTVQYKLSRQTDDHVMYGLLSTVCLWFLWST